MRRTFTVISLTTALQLLHFFLYIAYWNIQTTYFCNIGLPAQCTPRLEKEMNTKYIFCKLHPLKVIYSKKLFWHQVAIRLSVVGF